MTAAQPTPMASTSDMRSDRPTGPAAAPEARARRWAGFGDNPMQTVLAAAVVGLLIFSFTALDNKIDNVETRLNARIDALDNKIDNVETKLNARIDALDNKIDNVETRLNARIDALDNKIDEINLKLTALIAALGTAETVDAAVEGGLPDAETAGAETAGAPG